MRDGLAYVLITPYSLVKSRTGGIISRLLARSGLDLVGARMYAPSDAMVDEYMDTIVDADIASEPKEAFLKYIDEQLRPKNVMGITNRVMLLLFEGADATKVLKDRVIGSMTTVSPGMTVRGTYGDYVKTTDGRERYFEPAVLASVNPAMTREQLGILTNYALSDGGVIEKKIRIPKSQNPSTTLVLLTPDNFQRQTSTPGSVIDSFSRTGLYIVGAKVLHMTVDQATEFYSPVRKQLVEKLRPTLENWARTALEKSLGFELDDQAARGVGNALKHLNAEHEFSRIIEYMTGLDPRGLTASERSEPGTEICLALLYKGANALSSIRKTLGATNPRLAEGGTVRHMFGVDQMKNIAHASHSARSATRERKIVDLAPTERHCQVKEIIERYISKQNK